MSCDRLGPLLRAIPMCVRLPRRQLLWHDSILASSVWSLQATPCGSLLSVLDPALTAAGAYEGISEPGAISVTAGWGPTLVGTLVSFVVAYAAIAWLLR